MTFYQTCQIWNFDESSFHPDFMGSYSVQTSGVINIPKVNQKQRLIMANFISASGDILHPTFLDKTRNRELQKKRSAKMKLLPKKHEKNQIILENCLMFSNRYVFLQKLS